MHAPFPLSQPSSVPQQNHLSRGDSTAVTGTTLSRAQVKLTTLNSLALGNDLLGLGKDKLDVAWVGHVRVDLYLF